MSLRVWAIAACCLPFPSCGEPPAVAPAGEPALTPAAVPTPAPTPAPVADAGLVIPKPQFTQGRPTMAQATAAFASGGVQPGQPLPALTLLDLDGGPVDLAAFVRGRPLVLVTCSLTCNVARNQQAAVEDLRQKWGDRVAFAMVYTIDAHPNGDPCPYTGDDWVPPANRQDDALIRQPATLRERLAAARRFVDRCAVQTTVLVDTMDNASWTALGRAPNVGLCVGADGRVRERTAWFDAARIDTAVAAAVGN